MEISREKLIEKGWKSIGFDGILEYFAKEEEHDSILFVPVHKGVTIGYVKSENKNVINLLHDFISK